MNTADYVDSLVVQWKAEGMDPALIVWNTALACVGWAYVFGAWGAYCTVAERKKRYSDAHPDHQDEVQGVRRRHLYRLPVVPGRKAHPVL